MVGVLNNCEDLTALRRTLLLTGTIAVVMATSSSHGEPVPILNAGFENTPPHVLAPGQFTNGCGSGVQVLNPGGAPTGFFVTTTGWVSDTFRGGVLRPVSADYPGGLPEGQNVVWSEPATISQMLGTPIAADTVYTLQVSVGARTSQPTSGYEISLWAGGVLLAAKGGALPSVGRFEPQILTYVAPSSVPVGQLLQIQLRATGGPSDQANFDDVRLDASPACPVITHQPDSAVSCPIGEVTYSIDAVGAGALFYHWQLLDSAAGWIDLADGPLTVSGAKTCIAVSGSQLNQMTLTLNCPSDVSIEGIVVRCVVANGCGEQPSDPAGLTVCAADLNCDALVDFSDYLEFLNLYDASDLRVDFNGDDMVDFSDYLDFLNLYDVGC